MRVSINSTQNRTISTQKNQNFGKNYGNFLKVYHNINDMDDYFARMIFPLGEKTDSFVKSNKIAELKDQKLLSSSGDLFEAPIKKLVITKENEADFVEIPTEIKAEDIEINKCNDLSFLAIKALKSLKMSGNDINALKLETPCLILENFVGQIFATVNKLVMKNCIMKPGSVVLAKDYAELNKNVKFCENTIYQPPKP